MVGEEHAHDIDVGQWKLPTVPQEMAIVSARVLTMKFASGQCHSMPVERRPSNGSRNILVIAND